MSCNVPHTAYTYIDLFILVGSDGDKLRLFEDEGTESAVRNFDDVICSN